MDNGVIKLIVALGADLQIGGEMGSNLFSVKKVRNRDTVISITED